MPFRSDPVCGAGAECEPRSVVTRFLFRRADRMFLNRLRRIAYDVVVALRDNARDILGREMRRQADGDPRREPDSVEYWERQCELYAGTAVKLAKLWRIT